MKIKAIIFDLDDTLLNEDFTSDKALTLGIEAMIEKGFKVKVIEGLKKIKEIIKEDPTLDKFRELAKSFGQENDEIINAGHDKYINADIDEFEIFPDTIDVLNKLKGLGIKMALISGGSEKYQNKKIDFSKIRNYFDFIYISKVNEKKEFFDKVIKDFDVDPIVIMDVGNRIDSEIKIGNELDMITVRMLKGKYRFLSPREDNEKADYEINNLTEILEIVNE